MTDPATAPAVVDPTPTPAPTPAPTPVPAPPEALQDTQAPAPPSSDDTEKAYLAAAAGDWETAGRLTGRDPAQLRSRLDQVAKAQDGQRLALSMNLGHDVDSARAADIYDQANKTGLPYQEVDGALDQIKAATAKADFDPYAFRTTSPIVAKMAQSNPVVAAMMRPDMDKLGLWEQISNTYIRGAIQNEAEESAGRAREAIGNGTRNLTAERTFADMQQQLDALPAGNGGLLSRSLGVLASGMSHLGEWLDTESDGAFRAQSSGAAWLAQENVRDENGNQLDPQTRWLRARGGYALDTLITPLTALPGVGGAAGKSIGIFGSLAARKLLTESAMEAATVSAPLASRIIAHGAMAGASMADLAALGAVQGAGNSFLDSLAEIHDQEQHHRDFGTTWGAVAPDALRAAWSGAMDQIEAMGLPTLIGHGAGFALSEYAGAINRGKALRAMGTAMGETTQPPSALHDVAGNLGDAHGYPVIHVPWRDWANYWTDKGAHPEDTGEAITGNTEFQAARAEDRDMAIPTARYMTGIANSEHGPFFSTVARMREGEINEREALEALKPAESKGASEHGGYAEQQPGDLTSDEAVRAQNHGLIADLEEKVRTGDWGVPPEHMPVVEQTVKALADHMAATGAVEHPEQVSWIVDHLSDSSKKGEAQRVLHQAMQATAGPHAVGETPVTVGDSPQGAHLGPDGITIDKSIPRYRDIGGKLVDVHDEIARGIADPEHAASPEYQRDIAPLIEAGKDKGDLQSAVDAPAQAVEILGHGPVKTPAAKPAGPIRTKAAEAASAMTQEASRWRSVLLPESASDSAALAAHIRRESMGEVARRMEITKQILQPAQDLFRSMSVPERIKFWDNYERRLPQENAGLQQVDKVLGDIDREVLQRVEAVAPGKIRDAVEGYLHRSYKDPEAFNSWFAKRPLEGNKSAFKLRTYRYLSEAMEAGHEPLNTNPAEVMLSHVFEMEKFVQAHKEMEKLDDHSLREFVPVGDKHQSGWRSIKDKMGEVWGRPTMTMHDYLDKNMVDAADQLMTNLGISHDRQASLGAGVLGLSHQGADRIQSRAGTDASLIWHEIGHQLDVKYNLGNYLTSGKTALAEIRAVQALHGAAWAMKKAERPAVALELYTANRETMRNMAPTITARLEKLINTHPELEPLRDATPGLQRTKVDFEKGLPGPTLLGYWSFPNDVANIYDNSLSKGLRGSLAFRAVQKASNELFSMKLAFSAYHFAVTGSQIINTHTGLALMRLMDGRPADALAGVQRALNALGEGSKFNQEYREPGSVPEMSHLVSSATKGGVRISPDDFFREKAAARMADAWQAGNLPLAGVNGGMAFAQLPHQLLMSKWVPLLKSAATAELMRYELERKPGMTVDEQRATAAHAVDVVGQRFGQMVNDNAFWHTTVKDLAAIGVNAGGWHGGNLWHAGAAIANTAGQIKDIATGNRPRPISHAQLGVAGMAVLMGLTGAGLTYAMTGKGPQDARDYFFPRTGSKDENGDDKRITLPGYGTDIAEIAHDPESFAERRANILFTTMSEMVRNKDFQGTEIRNPDDPALAQAAEVAKHLGKTALPMTFDQVRKQGLSGILGIRGAPSWLVQTDAEQKAAELGRKNLPEAPRTQAAADKSQAEREIVTGLRSSDPKERQAAITAERTGGFTPEELQRIQQRAESPRLDYEVAHLSPDDAMRVWMVATPAERQRIQPIITQKLSRARSLDPDTRARYIRQLEKP